MTDPYVNFLGGSPLNRLSWLRNSPTFVNAIIRSPSTRWLIFNNGAPLLSTGSKPGNALARFPTSSITNLLGSAPFVGQGQHEGQDASSEHATLSVLEGARLRGPPIVFLGVEEPIQETGHKSSAGASALPSSEFTGKGDATEVAEKVKGTPYFAVDVPGPAEEIIAQLKDIGDAKYAFGEARSAVMSKFDGFEAALFAEARSMLDWNTRNKFCPGCGSSVYSLWAGWKLSCSSLLPWADNGDKPLCPSGKGLHNFAHPRSDPVVIMLAVDETGEKILMGHNRKFPGRFFSALAGFMEPGESFEDAVKREIWEEAGVSVWNVRYHSTQPWPFPANVMVGFYATADSSQTIRTDLDNELEEARWFTREEVIAVLEHREGTNFSRILGPPGGGAGALAHSDPSLKEADPKAAAAKAAAEGAEDDEPPFRIPPITAIAGVLIQEWAYGRVKHLPSSEPEKVVRRGNL